LANISGEYHRDINDFKWMCRSCHMIMDYKNNMRKIKPSKRIKGDLLLCSRCNNFKLINKFSKNKNVKGGYSYNCKECEKQRHHKYNIEKKYAKGIN